MSVIAVSGIPFKHSIKDAFGYIKRSLGGPHLAMSFSNQPRRNGTKTLYIRLSDKLDPMQVVNRINNDYKAKAKNYTAFFPDCVPDLPLATKASKKLAKLKGARNSQHHGTVRPHQVIIEAHFQIVNELQYKYYGLYNLSLRTGHKLLDELAFIIGERLKKLLDMQKKQNHALTNFETTSCYRKLYPHSGDFQLILSTLHKLQDEAGAPRMDLQEKELLDVYKWADKNSNNIPLKKIREACNNYNKEAFELIKQHIDNLDCMVNDGDDDETIARKKVWQEMKNMLPYLPLAFKQIIEEHFIPEEKPHRRMRIYGEPYLPNKDAMQSFTRKHLAPRSAVYRAKSMYNMICMNVEQAKHAAFMALDGTKIGGAKLVIRNSDIPIRHPQDSLRSALAGYFGGTAIPMENYQNEDEPRENDDEPRENDDEPADNDNEAMSLDEEML